MPADDNEDDDGRIPTSIVFDARQVKRRVKELGLDFEKLMQVVALAIAERTNATSNHCANAAGTFSYHYGTFGLRDKFVSGKWAVDRVDGIESIRNDELKIKVAFCNINVACDRFVIPKPRSEKGAGLERAALRNVFGSTLPQFTKKPKNGWALYYLMLADDGCGELSRPIVQNGTFSSFVERIFLGLPEDGSSTIEEKDDGPSNSYDPIVIPKTGT